MNNNSKKSYQIIFDKLDEAKEKTGCIEPKQFEVIKEINDEIAAIRECLVCSDSPEPIIFTRS
jgi:hypothetical protein